MVVSDAGDSMVYPGVAGGSAVIQIHRPRWSPGQTVREMMDTVWENHIQLFEDFVMMSLSIRFRSEFALFHGSVPSGSAQSPWKITPDAEMGPRGEPARMEQGHLRGVRAAPSRNLRKRFEENARGGFAARCIRARSSSPLPKMREDSPVTWRLIVNLRPRR